MNAEEAARAIGCSSRTVLRHVAKGTITATHKHAQELEITQDQVEKLRNVLASGTKSGQSTDTSQQIENLTARVAELEEKVRTLESGLVPLQERATVQATSPPVPTLPYVETLPKQKAQNRSTTRKSDLPSGCVLASKFATAHNVNRTTFGEHMTQGRGPGLIGTSTDVIPQRDQVAHSTRPKPGRPHETERYLDQDQQAAALAFWKRHSVDYSECDQPDCSCHKGETI